MVGSGLGFKGTGSVSPLSELRLSQQSMFVCGAATVRSFVVRVTFGFPLQIYRVKPQLPLPPTLPASLGLGGTAFAAPQTPATVDCIGRFALSVLRLQPANEAEISSPACSQQDNTIMCVHSQISSRVY